MTVSAKQLPELKKKRLSETQLQQPNIRRGQRGEQAAAAFLTSRGYRVLALNCRVKNREVDIVAKDVASQELVFVEVKTRTTEAFGWASNSVTSQKLRNLHTVARVFLKKYQMQSDYRFDIITVIGTRITQFKNITWI